MGSRLGASEIRDLSDKAIKPLSGDRRYRTRGVALGFGPMARGTIAHERRYALVRVRIHAARPG